MFVQQCPFTVQGCWLPLIRFQAIHTKLMKINYFNNLAFRNSQLMQY